MSSLFVSVAMRRAIDPSSKPHSAVAENFFRRMSGGQKEGSQEEGSQEGSEEGDEEGSEEEEVTLLVRRTRMRRIVVRTF